MIIFSSPDDIDQDRDVGFNLPCIQMKVLVYSAHPYDTPVLQAVAQGHELLFTPKNLKYNTAGLADGCQAVAIFTSDDASGSVLERLHSNGVRYVLLRSVGFDHIDIEKAALLGIRVANVPEYSPYSVAEHAIAMLMALNRKIVKGQQLMSLQDFRLDNLKGFDIHGKTVGVIGTGKIGMAFIRIMLGFGAKVIAFDPVTNQDALDLGVNYVSLDELLFNSDVISLHCPLTNNTRHLISSAQFNKMKAGAILINTSRGSVVDTKELIKALDSGKLGGACLDVYEFEKGLFFEDHSGETLRDDVFARLRDFQNVLATGHQAFLTEDALRQIAETTIFNINCFQNGLPCKNELKGKSRPTEAHFS